MGVHNLSIRINRPVARIQARIRAVVNHSKAFNSQGIPWVVVAFKDHRFRDLPAPCPGKVADRAAKATPQWRRWARSRSAQSSHSRGTSAWDAMIRADASTTLLTPSCPSPTPQCGQHAADSSLPSTSGVPGRRHALPRCGGFPDAVTLVGRSFPV